MASESHIFISYKHEDRESALRLRQALVDRGLNVWWDENLQTGQQWSEVIDEALMSASSVVVLWSEKAVRSDWVTHEASIAKIRGVLAHVTIVGTPPPELYRSIQFTSLEHWNDDRDAAAIDKLVSDLVSIRQNNRRQRILKTLSLALIGGLVISAIGWSGMAIQQFVEARRDKTELNYITYWDVKKNRIVVDVDNEQISDSIQTKDPHLVFLCQNLGSEIDGEKKFFENSGFETLVARMTKQGDDNDRYTLLYDDGFRVSNGDKAGCGVYAFDASNKAITTKIPDLGRDRRGYFGTTRDDVSESFLLKNGANKLGRKGMTVCSSDA